MTHASILVSAVVAVKNETGLLRRCIESLLHQTHRNLEIIIVDDGSDKSTAAVLQEYSPVKNIQVITLPDSVGQSAARNLAFRNCSGAFIAIADADDISSENRISEQLQFLHSHSEIDIVGSGFTVDESFHTWQIFHSPEEIYHQFLINNPLVHSSVMFRREILEHGMQYRSDYDTAEDYQVFAANRNQWKFANLNSRLVHYHIGEKGADARKDQKNKAAAVRSQVLEEYLTRPDPEVILTHQTFSELEPGISFELLRRHIDHILTGYKGLWKRELLKILYTHFWLYCSKNKVYIPILFRLTMIPRLGHGVLKSGTIFLKSLIN